MNAVSLNNLWNYLSGLSLTAQDKRWLSDKLIESEYKEETGSSTFVRTTTVSQESDEDFINSFFAVPYDNPMTAKEEIKMIRDSHYFDPERKVNHLNYEK